ncbi:DinB family protein [Uliginosibacterium sp. H1]|uniref:DinB family protein n=1 Tax=Uliginosibacterium sp. H1 TaxID=3114757 RepID=UPI002E197671|nr:DinB family protein [Uliginosibacterium sp. H1]
MSTPEHVRLMARYNRWMNERLLEACARLDPAALSADRRAFFGSLLGTLNHLVVSDTIWLHRFAQHPAQHVELDPVRTLPLPTSLDQIVCEDLGALRTRRALLDDCIEQWCAALSEADLQHVLHYRSTKGVPGRRKLGRLLLHFFNHQTHHRGQATTLISQAGEDMGATDLLLLIPEDET